MQAGERRYTFHLASFTPVRQLTVDRLYEPNLSQRPSGSGPKGKRFALFEQALANKQYGWLRGRDLNQRPLAYER